MEDKTIPSTDRARLKGCLAKWQQAKMLIGAALYVDALKPASLLSLNLQEDNFDVVTGLQSILEARKYLRKYSQENPQRWPRVRKELQSLEDDGVYQGATLLRYNEAAIQFCADQASADLNPLDESMRDRLEWSNMKMLRALMVYLDSQGWSANEVDRSMMENSDADSEDTEDFVLQNILKAADYIINWFREPLERQGTSLHAIDDEIGEMTRYARKYLPIDEESHSRIWYKLHICPDSRKWPNALRLCELGFSLPFSNAKVEKLFSSLKQIKTDRRTNLHTSTLNDLMEIKTAGPPLSKFSATIAINLWWRSSKTTRRVHQRLRQTYKRLVSTQPTTPYDSTESSEEDDTGETTWCALDLWDEWFGGTVNEKE